MNENNVFADGMAEMLRHLPMSFQKFVSMRDEAMRNQRSPVGDAETKVVPVDPGEGPPLEDVEYESIRKSLSEVGISILENIRNGAKSSRELAEKLGVSIATIKRKYREMALYGIIRTAPKCGVRLTYKGLMVLNRVGQRFDGGADIVSLVSKIRDTNDTIDTIDTI